MLPSLWLYWDRNYACLFSNSMHIFAKLSLAPVFFFWLFHLSLQINFLDLLTLCSVLWAMSLYLSVIQNFSQIQKCCYHQTLIIFSQQLVFTFISSLTCFNFPSAADDSNIPISPLHAALVPQVSRADTCGMKSSRCQTARPLLGRRLPAFFPIGVVAEIWGQHSLE